MENRNNSVHYKMYKSGKSIVYAGLVTTAALAGLTLANTNATAVHADTVAPQTEQSASAANNTASASASVDLAAIQQQQVVNNAKSDVASEQAVVSANKAALDSASQLNSGVAAVSNAQSAFNKASSDYYVASDAVAPATDASQKAKSALDNAKDWQNYFENEGGNAKYNDINSQINSAQSLLDYANETSAAVSTAASDALVAANSANAALAADPTNQDLFDAASAANAKLSKANINVMNNTAAIKKNTALIKSLNDKLNGKVALADGTTVNFVAGKKLVAQLPELQAAFDKAHQAYLDAIQARETAGDLATAKHQALIDAQIANNLMQPGTDAYKKLSSEAWQAGQELPSLKANPKVVAVNTAENNVKADEGVLAKANDTLKSAQKHLANVLATQTELEQELADAQKSDPDDKLGYVTAAKDALNNWKNGAVADANAKVSAAKALVKKAEDGLQWRKDLLTKAQNDPEYIKVSAQIQKDQALIDQWNQLQQNLKDSANVTVTLQALQAQYDNSVKLLNELQAKLAKEEAKLADMMGNNNNNNNGNQNNNNGNQNNNNGNQNNNNGNQNNNAGANTDATNGSATNVNGYTVLKNGAYYINGKQVTKAQYDAYVAKASLATVPASTKSASAAATASDSQALPQTGNENSAAVVALGAVSAMFGLGLAAKKREF